MEGNVIIADDDRSLRMILAQALSRAGCKVRATGTLSTLWRWLEDGEGLGREMGRRGGGRVSALYAAAQGIGGWQDLHVHERACP